MDRTYYRLRDSSPPTRSTPPSVSTAAAVLDELDSPDFLETHALRTDGGLYRTHLFLDGVHCAACVWLVERLPFHVEGVESARLNLPRARLTVEWNPEKVCLSEVASWLARFGYPVLPRIDGHNAPESGEERRLLIRMGVSWALAGNIMLIALALYSGLAEDRGTMLTAARWLSLLLAIPSVVYGGGLFFRRAWMSIRLSWAERTVRHLHMDTPISAGILTGFLASAWATVSGNGDVWFDSVAVLIAALLTARWLQLRARRLAGDSSEQLLALLPTMARRRDPDGTTHRVRADDLEPGTLVVVRPGELIPVDGVVHEGDSLVGSAILTGESRPLHASVGSLVYAGTTNEQSDLVVRVGSVGSGTRIGSLLSWVADQRNEAAPIVSLADRLGGWFTVTVLLLAVVTGIGWMILGDGNATAHVVALLVITCPCALGMATPLAMAVGLGRAARRGLFIKSEAVVERARTITTVVLDKTGTVTEGRMRVESVIGAADAVILAAAVEAGLSHPIAAAFAAATDGQALPAATAVRQTPASGVEGTVQGQTVRVGRPDWVSDAAPPPELLAAAGSMASAGKTPVAISVDGQAVAVVAIADPIRPDAEALVHRLSPRIRFILCSGDDEATTLDVGRRIGLDAASCLGRQRPEDKLALVQQLMRDGQQVLVVGDGVNDAGALQAATIGLAVAGGSAASQLAADVHATRPGLGAVHDLIVDSGRIMRVIHRNLGLSLGYNVLGAVLAIAGFVTPLVAAVAMPVSSFIVVLSSIFQRTFR